MGLSSKTREIYINKSVQKIIDFYEDPENIWAIFKIECEDFEDQYPGIQMQVLDCTPYHIEIKVLDNGRYFYYFLRLTLNEGLKLEAIGSDASKTRFYGNLSEYLLSPF